MVKSTKRIHDCENIKKTNKKGSKNIKLTKPLSVLPRSTSSSMSMVNIFNVEIHTK